MTLLEQLRALPPLPKRTWTSHNQGAYWPTVAPETREIVRICRSATTAFDVFNWTPIYTQSACALLAELNAADPQLDAQLAVEYFPYAPLHPYTQFGAKVAAPYSACTPPGTPTDPCTPDPRNPPGNDNDDVDELLLFEGQAIAVKAIAAAAGVRIGAVLLDAEQYGTRPPGHPLNPTWNSELARKQNRYYDAAKALFPGAVLLQYDCGAIYPNSDGDPPYASWTDDDDVGELYPLPGSRCDSLNVSCYQPHKYTKTLAILERMAQRCATFGKAELVPWFSLGSAFPSIGAFANDYRYAGEISRRWGRESCHPFFEEQFPAWRLVRQIALYPGPLAALTPTWLGHFVAFAQGATDPYVKLWRRQAP